MTDTRTRLATALSDPTVSERVLEAIGSIAQFDCTIPADSPLLPLAGLMADIDRSDAEIAAALLDLPEASLQIALRFTDPGMVDQPVLVARQTSDTDPVAYLATAVNGWGFLVVVHLLPERAALAGLSALVRDPTLDSAERVRRILALHPDIADLCSHVYANGAAPGQTGRFYSTVPLPWGTSFGHSDRCQVIDRDTNEVVLETKWARTCEAHALAMSAFPAIGAQMSALVTQHYGNGRPTAEATRAFKAAWDRLFVALGEASAEWRAAGNLPLTDPWAVAPAAAA